MRYKLAKAFVSLCLWAIGLYLIGAYSCWQISLGIFFCFWGNNVGKDQ